MAVEPSDIEDTSDWLGCPTELETITHYKLMLENEVQELNLQLRSARENIFGLVKMYDAASASFMPLVINNDQSMLLISNLQFFSDDHR
ncbi:hypothetical protein [Pseudomonas sp. NPDC086278]|uniref:hypothetical protein n=1 Tax=Pseudomonas sp. NPDC086278 TaxID=3390646 RepID=UPI003D05A57E